VAAAAARVAGPGTVIEPTPEGRRAGDAAHARYRRLFESLRPMFDDGLAP